MTGWVSVAAASRDLRREEVVATDADRGSSLEGKGLTLSIFMRGGRIAFTMLTMLCLMVSTSSFANEIFKIVHIECDRQAQKLEITPFIAYDTSDFIDQSGAIDFNWRPVVEKKIQRIGKSSYFLAERRIKNVCSLKQMRLEIDIRYNKPSASGECGGNPYGLLNIKANGKLVVIGEVVHDCMKIATGRVRFDPKTRWQRCSGIRNVADMNLDRKNVCEALANR